MHLSQSPVNLINRIMRFIHSYPSFLRVIRCNVGLCNHNVFGIKIVKHNVCYCGDTDTCSPAHRWCCNVLPITSSLIEQRSRNRSLTFVVNGFERLKCGMIVSYVIFILPFALTWQRRDCNETGCRARRVLAVRVGSTNSRNWQEGHRTARR